jgi:hypothetical protein
MGRVVLAYDLFHLLTEFLVDLHTLLRGHAPLRTQLSLQFRGFFLAVLFQAQLQTAVVILGAIIFAALLFAVQAANLTHRWDHCYLR